MAEGICEENSLEEGGGLMEMLGSLDGWKEYVKRTVLRKVVG